MQYDWDLAIKWVVLFIDGVNHARWIAIKSDVDMEMVQACLRVLKHHGVIELMDMFFYSNHYEFTQRATAMLAGKEPKLLEEAIDYTTRRHQRPASISPIGMIGDRADRNLDLAQASSARQSDRFFRPISEGVMSFPPASSLLASSLPRVGSKSKEIPRSIASRRERKIMKLALAELYCSCHRNISFAELRISKVAPPVSSSTVPYKRESRGYSTGDVASGIPDSQARDYHQLRRYSTAESERSADFRGRKWSDLSDLDLKSKVPQRGIDWNEAFEVLDHRRCITFGVVHGLLRRVHNFPLAIEEKQGRINSEATQTNNPKLVPMRERGISFRSTVSDNGQEGSLTLASRIATMMDGSKCDDELVCEFERPLDELFELVEATGKRVLSIYSL
jgi:Nitrogen permease regulator 2